MLSYAPPSSSFPDPATIIDLPATILAHEELTVPAGRGTDAALQTGYDRDSHYSGVLVNTSSNTFWLLFVPPGDPAPSKNDVIDLGIRVNQNGSTFVIPDYLQGDLYVATSSTNTVIVRAFYYGRSY